jgi:diguanylate cyclase (GGDEF)-like protein
LLVMDLSGFKAINDRLGHKEGDRALQAVASALKKQRRNGDSLYRWGGDEFAAILPHAALEGAIAAATRYHRAIGALEIGGMRLGVNIGAACFPKEAQDAEALLHLADERMYQAKSRKLPFAMD